MKTNDESLAVDEVVHRLSARFSAFDVEDIADLVHECHASFGGSPIRNFVPLLVEHTARDRLQARLALTAEDSPPEVHVSPAVAQASMLRIAFGDGKAWAIL